MKPSVAEETEQVQYFPDGSGISRILILLHIKSLSDATYPIAATA